MYVLTNPRSLAKMMWLDVIKCALRTHKYRGIGWGKKYIPPRIRDSYVQI